jgi:outer membrane protein assembly factor BamA
MKNKAFISAILCSTLFLTCTQSSVCQSDTASSKKKEVKKEGFTWFPLPVIAYDADMGFQYGIIGSIQLFGDGSTYPEYRHQFLCEISRFTKGSGVNQFFYDSKYLLPKNIRITLDISYLTERALDFYGFNGYESVFDPDLMDDGSDNYISRVYYRHERKLFRFISDFQGRITGNELRWFAGLSLFNIQTGTVNIDRLNKGKDEDEKLPDTALLYDKYVEWGIISEKEHDGGQTNFFKAGLIYDTRDKESNPARGVWEEVILMTAPRFFWNKEFAFTKLEVTHRHYIPLVKQKLTLAYRISYQGTISGSAPFYLQPYLISSFSTCTKPDGIGGAKSLRGVLRNRAVGDGIVFGNIELRWKFLKTTVLKQNVYLALHGFADAGQVVQPVHVDKSLLPATEEYSNYFDQSTDSMHWSFGAGLRIAINENFIIAVDYGFAADSRDGRTGLYVGINNLF